MPEAQVVPIHPTILVWQEEMLRQYARDEGLLGVSEALRRILTEWRNFKTMQEKSRESEAVREASVVGRVNNDD